MFRGSCRYHDGSDGQTLGCKAVTKMAAAADHLLPDWGNVA